MNVGDRVRVMPSGEPGTIRGVTEASDGRTVYDVEFDNAREGGAETGGLYVEEELALTTEGSMRR